MTDEVCPRQIEHVVRIAVIQGMGLIRCAQAPDKSKVRYTSLDSQVWLSAPIPLFFQVQEEYLEVLRASGALLVLGPKHGAGQAFAAAADLGILHATAVLVQRNGEQQC